MGAIRRSRKANRGGGSHFDEPLLKKHGEVTAISTAA
jgi:hypothetical protein